MTRWMRQAGPHSDNFKLQGVIGYGGCTPSKNDGMQVHQHASRREFQTLNSVEIESSICTRSLGRIGLMLLAFTDPGEKTNAVGCCGRWRRVEWGWPSSLWRERPWRCGGGDVWKSDQDAWWRASR